MVLGMVIFQIASVNGHCSTWNPGDLMTCVVIFFSYIYLEK